MMIYCVVLLMYTVQDLLQLAKELIGKTIYVGWPYLNEAMVHSISDGAVQYYQVSENKINHKYCMLKYFEF